MNGLIFYTSYSLGRPNVVKYYKKFTSCGADLDTLRARQKEQLIRLLKHCRENVPYYADLFRALKFEPEGIGSVEDLGCLPVLNKATIRKNPELFLARGYQGKSVAGSTGGSTGTPLKYVMSAECYERGVALLLRGWGRAGYRPGDRMLIVAGGSLTSRLQSRKSRFIDLLTNQRHFSSYGVDEAGLLRVAEFSRRWRPKYLRGYATSLYLLARCMERNNIDLGYRPAGIFSTAEVLPQSYREAVERIFGAPVFDNYGLNDGGISAFECREHSGMHIDCERAILECVDESGTGVKTGAGKFLATSLYNYAMPFVRYDTGDTGTLDHIPCRCGCPSPLLRGIDGRTTDYLKLNGRIIASPVLTVLMGKVDLESYQIVQVDDRTIDLKYVKHQEELSKSQREYLRKSLCEHVGGVAINFRRTSAGEISSQNKHKFIINEVCR